MSGTHVELLHKLRDKYQAHLNRLSDPALMPEFADNPEFVDIVDRMVNDRVAGPTIERMRGRSELVDDVHWCGLVLLQKFLWTRHIQATLEDIRSTLARMESAQ